MKYAKKTLLKKIGGRSGEKMSERVDSFTTSLWCREMRDEKLDVVLVEPDTKCSRRMILRFLWHRVADGAYGVIAIVDGYRVCIERKGAELVVRTERGAYKTKRVTIMFNSLYDLEMHQKICREDTGCIYVFYSATAIY
jgi:hypothetical protein